MNEGLFALLPMPFYWAMLVLLIAGAAIVFIDWEEDGRGDSSGVPDQKTFTVNRR